MSIPQHPNETVPMHIGDGVYASYDGSQIWLRTERATDIMRGESVIHEIALDRHTFSSLLEYRIALLDMHAPMKGKARPTDVPEDVVERATDEARDAGTDG